MTIDKSTNPKRRSALKLMGASAIMSIGGPMLMRKANAKRGRIVVRDSGGPFTKGFAEAFYKPFTAATGIEVVGVTSSAEPTSQIRSMVETGSYSWDVAGISLAAIQQLVQNGDYIEKHGLDSDPLVQQISPEYRDEYGVGSDVYSTVLAYRTDVIKEPLTSWADLWDVERIKGRRSIRKYPFDTIEEALFAAGATAQNVYPCDLDKAFKKLDEIKPHVDAWWTSGAQSTQMLINGEVDMLPTWIARVQAARAEGAHLGVMWDKNLWGVDAWAILKGTPNADLCREFIKFTCDAKRQAAFTPYVANGPTNPNAFEFVEKSIAENLPTYEKNRKLGVPINNEYWAKNKDVAIERFNSWILS